MKKATFYLLFSIISFVLFAQNIGNKKFYIIDNLDLNELSSEDRQLLDSSLTRYHKETVDTSKLNILNNICENLESSYWEDYQSYLYDELKLRQNQKSKTIKRKIDLLLIDSYNNMALINLGRNELNASLNYVETGLKLAEEYSNEEAKASLLNNKGGVFVKKSEFEKAMIYFNESLEIRKKSNDPSKIANSINNIGNILIYYGENDKALQNFKNGLRIQQEIDDVNGIIFSHYNIATVFKNLGKYDSALIVINENIDLIKKLNVKKELASNLELASVLNLKTNNILNAVKLLNESLNLRVDENNVKKIISNKYLIASSYYELGLFNKSLEFIDEFINEKKISEFPNEFGKAINLKVDLHIALSEFEKAIQTLDMIKNDSNFNTLFLLKKGAIYLYQNDYKNAEEYLLKSYMNYDKYSNITNLEIHDLYYSLATLYYNLDNEKCVYYCNELIDSRIEMPKSTLLLIAQVNRKYGSQNVSNKYYDKYFIEQNNALSNINQIYELAQSENDISKPESNSKETTQNKDEDNNWLLIFSVIINILMFFLLIKKNKNN